MSARIKISQAGLSAGVAGRSRTDGLATGALVTLEDVSGTGSSTFHLLWGPPEDTTAEATLAATGDPDVWTFSPTAAAYGSYLIELRVAGSPVERRIFGVRTPNLGLLVPAFNERASRHAGWQNDGADQIELSEQNANDYPPPVLNALRYAGYWRTWHELYLALDGLRGLGLTLSAGKLAVRQRPRSAQLKDYFLSGNNTSGQVGSLGWNILGTAAAACTRTNATFDGAANRVSLVTGAALNDRAVLSLGLTENAQVAAAVDVKILQTAWKFAGQLTSKRAFFGLHDNLAIDAASAVNALGIYYDSAVSPNYQIIARSASSGTPTVTTLPVPSNTLELISIVRQASGAFQFYSGNTLIGTISSGIPTAAMNVGFRVESLTTATRSLQLAYFGLDASGIGALDDDAFLEA